MRADPPDVSRAFLEGHFPGFRADSRGYFLGIEALFYRATSPVSGLFYRALLQGSFTGLFYRAADARVDLARDE